MTTIKRIFSGCSGIIIGLAIVLFISASIALISMVTRKINEDKWYSDSHKENCTIIGYTIDPYYFTNNVNLDIQCVNSTKYELYIGSHRNTLYVKREYPLNSSIILHVNREYSPHVKIIAYEHHIGRSTIPYFIAIAVAIFAVLITVVVKCREEYEELE